MAAHRYKACLCIQSWICGILNNLHKRFIKFSLLDLYISYPESIFCYHTDLIVEY